MFFFLKSFFSIHTHLMILIIEVFSNTFFFITWLVYISFIGLLTEGRILKITEHCTFNESLYILLLLLL